MNRSKSLRIVLFAAVLALCSLIDEAAAMPSTVTLTCVGDEQSLALNIAVDPYAKAKIIQSPSHAEVLFRFDNEISLKIINKLKDCGPLLQDVQGGFNSLLLVGQQDTRLSATKFPNGYGVEFIFADSTENSNDSDVHLALERARLLYKQGKVKESVEILDVALESSPYNPDLLFTQMSYRSAAGDTHGAAKYADQWAHEEPDQAKLNTEYKQATSPYQSRVGVSYESIEAGDTFRQDISTAQGTYVIAGALPADTVTVKAQLNNAYFDDLADPSGELRDIYPETHRFELGWNHPFESDNMLLALTASDYTFGGHAAYEARDLTGATIIRGSLDEPNWEYASGVAYEGTKSAFSLARQQRINSRINTSLEVGGNYYGITDDSNVAESVSVTGNLSWLFYDDTKLPLTFNYMLDGEYFSQIDSRIDSQGVKQDIFSAQDNEFHVFTVGTAYEIQKADYNLKPFSLYGYAGYSVNRLGPDSPQFGGGIRGGWWQGPDFSVEAGRTFSTTAGENTTQNRILASINWNM